MRTLCLFVLMTVVSACNAPAPPGVTGGIGDAATMHDGGLGRCARGLAVVEFEGQSSNVSLMAPDGSVQSASFYSSSTPSAGVQTTLSGDIDVPTMPASGSEIVLLERSPAPGRVLWIDLSTGELSRQMAAGQGFWANPHDYVEIASDKAYVTRYEENPSPDERAFNRGSDVAIVDPKAASIVGSIDLTTVLSGSASRFLPRPDRMILTGGFVYVLLGVYDENFDSGDGRLVAIDPASDTIVDVLVLEGFEGCAGLAVSPAGDEIAVTCSGRYSGGNNPDPAVSGLAIVEPGVPLSERRRFVASELGGQPLGFYAAYVADSELAITTFGREETPAVPDRFVTVDLETGGADTLLESEKKPFTLGGVECTCGACFLTDAGRGGVVHRYRIDDGRLVDPTAVTVETRIGLPPRQLGLF